MAYLYNYLPEKIYPVGYASGCFDLFHIGHLRYLQRAATCCEQLIVGLPVDAIVKANKGKNPINTCEQRMEIIAALRCVTQVVRAEISAAHTDAYVDFIRQLGINGVFIGEDWRGTPRWQPLEPILRTHGINVHFLSRTPDISTTLIKQSIPSREL